MAKSNPPTKKKYIESNIKLLDMWEEYELHVLQNPEEIEEVTPRGIVTRRVRKPLMKQGFYNFVYKKYRFHIHQYFDNAGKRYDSYVDVVTYIRARWECDQISGTLTGRFKAPNLVARLNGLSESQKNEVTITEIKADFGT
jgi:hypothetical protein